MKRPLIAAAFALLATTAHAKKDCVGPFPIDVDPYFYALAEKGQTLLMANMTPLYREANDQPTAWATAPTRLVRSARVNLGTPMTHARFCKGDK